MPYQNNGDESIKCIGFKYFNMENLEYSLCFDIVPKNEFDGYRKIFKEFYLKLYQIRR